MERSRHDNGKFGIDAGKLRLLAILFMLLDHIWVSLVPGNLWMHCMGRLAFPIFAFQISEGYIHTKDFRRYALRLLFFALLSEIPFDLFCTGSAFFPFYQNVLFTLLLGLLAVRQADMLRREQGIRRKLLHGLLLLLAAAGGVLLFPDYGLQGVMTVLCFYVFQDVPYARLFQLAAMLVLNLFAFKGQMLPLSVAGLHFEIPMQGFAVFALLPIWLYNGKKGKGGKALRVFWYAFYPLHMLALYFLQQIIL